jgi:hypothetical protein
VSHLENFRKPRSVPEKRELALLKAMREIKVPLLTPARPRRTANGSPVPAAIKPAAFPHPQPIEETPPFEPVVYTTDRSRPPPFCAPQVLRRYRASHRRTGWAGLGQSFEREPGGCFVETATPIPPGSVGIGLWVANGKIWVKGVILTGVITRSAPSFGVRVKFSRRS